MSQTNYSVTCGFGLTKSHLPTSLQIDVDKSFWLMILIHYNQGKGSSINELVIIDLFSSSIGIVKE